LLGIEIKVTVDTRIYFAK